MTGFNLPPGVTETMLPGNRREDVAYQRYVEGLSDDDLIEFFENEEFDAGGLVVYSDDESGAWLFEAPGEPVMEWPQKQYVGWSALVFDTRDDAIAYVLAFHDDQLLEEMGSRYLEGE